MDASLVMPSDAQLWRLVTLAPFTISLLTASFACTGTVGGKQTVNWQAEVDSSDVFKSAAVTTSAAVSDQSNGDDDVVAYRSSLRGSRVVNVSLQPPPPPPPAASRRAAADQTSPASEADDADSSCWRQQPVQRTTGRQHICTLPHGRRPPVAPPSRYHPLWD